MRPQPLWGEKEISTFLVLVKRRAWNILREQGLIEQHEHTIPYAEKMQSGFNIFFEQYNQACETREFSGTRILKQQRFLDFCTKFCPHTPVFLQELDLENDPHFIAKLDEFMNVVAWKFSQYFGFDQRNTPFKPHAVRENYERMLFSAEDLLEQIEKEIERSPFQPHISAEQLLHFFRYVL
jgi:hypothetical protein